MVGLGVILAAVFVTLWILDARRSRREAHDPERLHQDPHERHLP